MAPMTSTSWAAPMTTSTKHNSLASLAVLSCITLLTGAAFVAITYTEWDWLSALLGVAVIVLVVLCVRLVLDVVEEWLDRAEDDPGSGRPS